jgi:hypothetical protein
MASKKAAAVKAEAETAEKREAEAPKKVRKAAAAAAPEALGGPEAETEVKTPRTRKTAAAAPAEAPPAPQGPEHETPHDAPDHITGLAFAAPEDATSKVVGELHRTRSRHTRSLIVTVRTTDEPTWLDETRGKYAAICADHGYVEYYATRAGMFADWTRPTYCPVCQHFNKTGQRLETDPLRADAAAEPEPEGAPDSEILTPPSPAGAEAAPAETPEAEGEGEAPEAASETPPEAQAPADGGPAADEGIEEEGLPL